MKKQLGFAITIASAVLVASSTNAATLIVDVNGKLTGATGVNVGGSFYDVVFAEGTCGTVFSGCDQASDLNFSSQASAQLGAQALLDQVFQDTFAGAFDTSYGLVFGCGPNVASGCGTFIPYALGANSFSSVNAINYSIEFADTTSLGGQFFNFNSSESVSSNFAVFTLAVTAIPESATWTMMLLGFSAIGGAMRYQRRKTSVSFG